MSDRAGKAVYTIVSGHDRVGNPKDIWVRIGWCFIAPDGSHLVQLDALPVNGKLIMKSEDPPEEAGGK